MTLADLTLDRLLRRAETARVRASSRTIRESFKKLDSPYWQLPLPERDALHARMAAAQNAGAVELEWSRKGGEARPLDAVRLVSLEHLAAFLGRDTEAARVEQAQKILGSRATQPPRVGELLAAWTALKAPRGFDPQSASDFLAALRVLDALDAAGADQVERVLSTALFRDSKRIEALSRHLDVLTAETLSSAAREWTEVFAELGLIKEPLPMLFAGAGSIVLAPGRVSIVAPFVGLASNAIVAYHGEPQWVLSIENLTTFHQAAQAICGRQDGLIVFTGGMPSPSWRGAYRRILDCVSPLVPVYHWGDIDRGGFRIAAKIASCVPAGRVYLPWKMDARSIDSALVTQAAPAVQKEMARYARNAGWGDLAAGLPALTCEQEALAVALP